MRYEILIGDALGHLDLLPSGSVDCVVTDPPFGDTSLEWDVIVRWLPAVRRLLMPHGSVWFFTSLRHLLTVDLTGWKLAQDVVWEKHNGSSFHADRFKRVHEHAVQLYPADRPWSGVHREVQTTPDATARSVRRKARPPHTGHIDAASYVSEDGGPRLMRSVIPVRSCHGHAVHPTQKPEGIVEPLVRYSCPPGGLVLDPFAGSGTTGVVALSHGRRFLGIELNPAYAALAIDRCEKAVL